MAAPTIHTYHCLCTSLLLASTHTLSSLPRRAAPSLDNAIILPLPSTPDLETEFTTTTTTRDRHSSSENDPSPLPGTGFTVLLSTTHAGKPTVVSRPDGFEKRYLLRCGRCRLVVGYELEDGAGGDGDASAMDVDGPRTAVGKGLKVAYLLPAGIVSTDAMAAGKISEADVGLGGKERSKAVAAWETA